MQLQTFETVAIAVALIAFIAIRQAVWQPVNVGRLARMPIVFAVIGGISLISSVPQLGPDWHVGTLDLAVILTELTLGVPAGWLMGRTTQIRRFGDVLKSRLAPAGLGVWIGFLVLRIGLAVLVHVFHAQLAEQTGTILIVVAEIKAIQVVMVRERLDRHHAGERQSSFITSAR